MGSSVLTGRQLDLVKNENIPISERIGIFMKIVSQNPNGSNYMKQWGFDIDQSPGKNAAQKMQSFLESMEIKTEDSEQATLIVYGRAKSITPNTLTRWVADVSNFLEMQKIIEKQDSILDERISKEQQQVLQNALDEMKR